MRIIIDDVYVERGAAAAAASAAAATLACSTPHAVLEGSLERGEGASEESGEAAEMSDFLGFSEGNHLARGGAFGVQGDGFSGVASFLPASKQQQQQQSAAVARGTVVQHHQQHLFRQRSPVELSGNAPAGSAFYVQQPAHGKPIYTRLGLLCFPRLTLGVFFRRVLLCVSIRPRLCCWLVHRKHMVSRSQVQSDDTSRL